MLSDEKEARDNKNVKPWILEEENCHDDPNAGRIDKGAATCTEKGTWTIKRRQCRGPEQKEGTAGESSKKQRPLSSRVR